MKTPAGKQPLVPFIYEDHRTFLKDRLDYARRFGMTRKEFLRRTGITSPALISDVLSCRKKIPSKHIRAFSDALELGEDESLYFELMVKKDNCRSASQKASLGRELAELRIKNLSKLLENKHLEYFTSWKYPVIREFLIAKKAISSPLEVTKALVNLKLTSREVESALRKLVNWGFADYDGKTGQYRPAQKEKVITYKNLPHALLGDVKKKMMETAVHAMETMDKQNRHATMAIRGLSEEKYRELCRRIDELRAEFLNLESETGSEDRVVVLNIQAFPVMKFGAVKGEENE
ncbi:MAG: TIGR02147 family protein [Chitinispirillaceae bacterium]